MKTRRPKCAPSATSTLRIFDPEALPARPSGEFVTIPAGRYRLLASTIDSVISGRVRTEGIHWMAVDGHAIGFEPDPAPSVRFFNAS